MLSRIQLSAVRLCRRSSLVSLVLGCSLGCLVAGLPLSKAVADNPISYHSIGFQFANVDILDDHARDIEIDYYDDFSLVYEAQFRPQYSLIISASTADVDVLSTSTEGDLTSYNLGFRRYFPSSSNPWRQFAGLGLRRVEIESPNNSDIIEEDGFYGEAGIQGLLNRRFLAEAGVRLHTATKNGIIEAAPFVGLRVLLGAKYPTPIEVVEPVAVPAPVVVKDDDSDGVVNENDACPATLPRAIVDSRGCALTQSLTLRETLYVTFKSGSAVVGEQAARDVLSVVKLLKAYPTTQITLIGHTDAIGRSSDNMRLSIARANAVKMLLVKEFDILPSRILTQGKGESMPIANNESKEGRAANRRVEAFIEVQKTETRFKLDNDIQDQQAVAAE